MEQAMVVSIGGSQWAGGSCLCHLEKAVHLPALPLHTCIASELIGHRYLCSTRRKRTVKKWNVFTKMCSLVEKKKCGCKFLSPFQYSSKWFADCLKVKKRSRDCSHFSQKFYLKSHSSLYSERPFSIFVSMFFPISRYEYYWPILYNSIEEFGAPTYQ